MNASTPRSCPCAQERHRHQRCRIHGAEHLQVLRPLGSRLECVGGDVLDEQRLLRRRRPAGADRGDLDRSACCSKRAQRSALDGSRLTTFRRRSVLVLLDELDRCTSRRSHERPAERRSPASARSRATRPARLRPRPESRCSFSMRVRSVMSRSATVRMRLVADLQLRDRRLGRELLAVLAQTSDRGQALPHATRGHVAGREALDVLTMSLAKPLGDQRVERSPDGLRLRVAEDLLRAIVEDGDSLLVIDGDDRVGRDRDDPGELRLRLLEPLLRDLDLLDIGAGAEPFDDLPVRAEQRHASDQPPLVDAIGAPQTAFERVGVTVLRRALPGIPRALPVVRVEQA